MVRGLLERSLRLYYTARATDTPGRLKFASLLVAIYFFFPFDLIADILPLIGFGDDILALSILGWRLSRHTTDEIRWHARVRARQIIA